ncbi:recombinase family protein [Cysteiniphilum marinum]|uniref:recombinase family protein n=1 Tax=Cysteiniphilum marinum TaxID=2774191 RepID=UPI001F237DFE|nr:recombinase family protein [Cysteiniphilum marinum]
MEAMGQLVGYARVSSSGQSLDVQLGKLKKYGCHKIYKEKISGVDQNRPQLLACLDYIREGDTLVITRLDRMARSSLHLGQIVNKLEKKQANFIVLDQQIDTTTSHGKLMFHMLSAFAEFENQLRKERQIDGINKAQENGVKFGRKFKLTRDKVKQIRESLDSEKSVSDILKEFNISRSTYYIIKSGRHPYIHDK